MLSTLIDANAVIHDHLIFYNIAELAKVEGKEGLRLQRVPESLRPKLDEGTAGVMLSAANCEIRFRMAKGQEKVSITLSAEEPSTAHVYHGPFQGRVINLDKTPQEIVIKKNNRMNLLTPEQKKGFRYNPDLVRICFGGAYPEPVYYHGHGDGIELPKAEDVPAKTYLAYGSSIAHGTDQLGAALSYPGHTAWKLGTNLKNFGASGCCLCEPDLADFLAEQSCDVVSLELSVNLLGRGFTAAEFRERAAYMVKKITDADPKRKVACITIFPFHAELGVAFANESHKATPEEYRQILRNIVKELNRPNLSLIEGPELLTNIEGLSQDLIHPGSRGAIEIGENLANRLKHLL